MANILVKKNEEEVVTELCKLVEKEAKDAIAAHGTFHLGLSGGSLASFLCRSRVHNVQQSITSCRSVISYVYNSFE